MALSLAAGSAAVVSIYVMSTITTQNWLLPPFNRASFQRVAELFPTATLRRGAGPPVPLPPAAADPAKSREKVLGFTYTGADGSDRTIAELLLHAAGCVFVGYVAAVLCRWDPDDIIYRCITRSARLAESLLHRMRKRSSFPLFMLKTIF